MKQIIPSIIAKNQKELRERLDKVKFSKTFHLDIMDGKFVKNKSLMFDFKLPKGKKYIAHLMIRDPVLWVRKNWKKVDIIIFHTESCRDDKKIKYLIKLIKSKKRKVGISLNPETPTIKIKSYVSTINKVLVMSVNPGKYGGKFIPLTLRKIKELKKLRKTLKVGIDGGINDKTITSAIRFGADTFVVGSYLQKSSNPKKTFSELKSRF